MNCPFQSGRDTSCNPERCVFGVRDSGCKIEEALRCYILSHSQSDDDE